MHSIDSLFHDKFQPYVSLNLLFNIMVLYYNSIVFLSFNYTLYMMAIFIMALISKTERYDIQQTIVKVVFAFSASQKNPLHFH